MFIDPKKETFNMTRSQPHGQVFPLRLILVLVMLLSGLGAPSATYADESVALPTTGEAAPLTTDAPMAPLGLIYTTETEPNDTFGTATPLTGSSLVVRAPLFPNGDIDFYSFNAAAGDRVYAATMTSFSAGSSTDSQLTLLDVDGATLIEFDDDNGSFAGFSSSMAGATIPVAGTYYLKVNDFTAGTTSERSYEMHFRLQSGTPTDEVEANDTPATANPLAASGWMTGTRNPALATEQDWYSLTLNAGDTVFLSLDLDPERDGVTWNGRLGFALFGDASNQILVVDDAGASETPNPTIPSEAFFMTVKTAGTYYAFVDSATAATGGPTATYNLNVSIYPTADEGLNCTTYTSTDVPKTIGPGAGLVSSTITVPGNPRIADIDVDIVLNHALMADVDAHLRSPAGNDNGLFTDIGAAATGGQTQMDLVLDDEAGLTPSFTVLKGLVIKPELAYRLAWFDGEDAGGTWTLDLRDDLTNASGGTLTSWSIRICEPLPPPACPSGSALTTLFSTDFEANDGGFTHSGVADEWEYGLPATLSTTTANPVAAFDTCYSGANCWKTDLDNTYDVSSSQDLLSPAIPLTVAGLVGPVYLSWAQRYQMESASFDHAFVDVQQVGGATPTRLWEWLDATMTNAPGNPVVNLGASSGWSVFTKTISSYVGQNIEALFHVDSDTTINFGGLAIDDVSVTGCVTLPNVPPVANAGTDQTVDVSAIVTLDGSGSSDPDNNLPLTYGWVQSGGPAVTLSDATFVKPTFTAPATPTVLTFTLTVNDSLGASSLPDEVVITTAEVAISGLTADNDSPTSLGNATALSAAISAGTNVTYDWDFGDGMLGSGATLAHTYSLVGTYTATVTATNSLSSVNATTLVTITAAGVFGLYLPVISR